MHRFNAFFIAIIAGLAVGFISARVMMQRAAVAEGGSAVQWQEIRVAGDSLSTLYRRSHFLTRGEVPPPADVHFFTRATDDDGNVLRGDCVVTLSGTLAQSRWWFIGSEGGDGTRHTLDAGSAIFNADGSLTLRLSKAPAPGNWIALDDAGPYTLQLVLQDSLSTPEKPLLLPAVKRAGC